MSASVPPPVADDDRAARSPAEGASPSGGGPAGVRRAALVEHGPAAAAGGLLGALLMWTVHRGLIDDAYITLAFAQDLAAHLHWGLVPTLTSNSATSPLNVMLLALGAVLTGVSGSLHPVVGLGIVTVAASTAMGWWASQVLRGLSASRAWAVAVVVVVLSNPFLSSAVGLEVVPLSALLVGLLAQAVRRRPTSFGVLAGLVILTRLDLVIFVVSVALLTPAVRRRLGPAVGVAAAVCLPWFALSWWFLGSAIPSTFAIKTLQHSFSGVTFLDGLWRLWGPRSPSSVLLAVVPAGLGALLALPLAALAVRRRARADGRSGAVAAVVGLAVGGLAYAVAYSLLGVPPYQWYYVPSTVSLGVVAVLGLAALTRAAPAALARVGAGVVAVGLVVAFAVPASAGSLPWRHPPLFGNWAAPTQYLAAGQGLRRAVGDAPVLAPPEIGTVAYACRCTVLDGFSDPGRTLPLIEQRIDEAGPVTKALLRANFARLDRSVRPVTPAYRFVWSPGPPPAGVPSWATDSPAVGPGSLHLEPAG